MIIQTERSETSPVRNKRRRRLVVLFAVLLATASLLAAVVVYLAHNAEPLLRKRIVADISARFHSPVELDAIHISVAHGLLVSGSGLRILYIAGPSRPDAHPEGAPPMLSVDHFEFRTGLRELFEPTMRVVTVFASGMRLNIPPSAPRGANVRPDDPKRAGQSRLGIVVDKVVCTDLTLSVETSNPAKPPLVFDIRNLTLTNVGRKEPLLYDASLVNPKPVGQIRSNGHFGPWQDDNPRDTSIDGQFRFTDANLGTIKGISGTLSSTGTFAGQLGQIAVTGTSDVPDFAVEYSEHRVALHTDFQAIVDGTSGDTTLTQVRAAFLHTVLFASGSILRSNATPQSVPAGYPGHDIELRVTSAQARVEDLLRLGARTSPPLLRGATTLRTDLSIKPGPESVPKKMHLRGTFNITGATFANPKFQDTVDKLSVRAQGRPQLAKADEAPVIASQMGGSFELANAVMHVPAIDYTMPGAKVHLAGDYSLDGERFEFAGVIRTQATASEMLTGWKSLLAMPFDGLLKKNGAGVELPIKISGTKSDPKFGLDLDKMHLGFLKPKKDEPAKSPPRAH